MPRGRAQPNHPRPPKPLWPVVPTDHGSPPSTIGCLTKKGERVPTGEWSHVPKSPSQRSFSPVSSRQRSCALHCPAIGNRRQGREMHVFEYRMTGRSCPTLKAPEGFATNCRRISDQNVVPISLNHHDQFVVHFPRLTVFRIPGSCPDGFHGVDLRF